MNFAQTLGYRLGSPSIQNRIPVVFVVDEDISAGLALEGLILSEGLQAETFASAQEFLARPKPPVPNCMILAISQNTNSLEVQKQIAQERMATPIIVISSCEDTPTTVQAMKAGAVDFLVKPCGHDCLLAAVLNAVAWHLIAKPSRVTLETAMHC